MPPSKLEATKEGDCRTRPLKSTRRRAKDQKRLDALLEATKKRAFVASDTFSDDEDCYDRFLDKCYYAPFHCTLNSTTSITHVLRP